MHPRPAAYIVRTLDHDKRDRFIAAVDITATSHEEAARKRCNSLVEKPEYEDVLCLVQHADSNFAAARLIRCKRVGRYDSQAEVID